MSQKPCLPIPACRRRKREDDGEIIFDDIQQMDATRYLRLVMAEASRLPEVFESTRTDATSPLERPRDKKVPPLILGSAASARYLVSHRTCLRLPPTVRHCPAAGLQWVERTLANFSRLRSYMTECQTHGVGGKTPEAERVPLPPMKDVSAWHTFCVGPDDASGNPGGYFHDSDNDESENEGDVADWKKHLPTAGYSPTVRLLLQMDQVMIRRVLGHLTHYATNEEFPITGQRAAWIYALLSRLERPIHRDDAVTLYSLLKKMTALREKMKVVDDDRQQPNVQSSEQRDLATLNVLIAIVGIYFEQGGGYANVMEAKTV